WLNALYIDVTAVPGFVKDSAVRALAAQADIEAARASELVDYQAVAGLKRPVLEALFRQFQSRRGDDRLRIEFREFQLAGGLALGLYRDLAVGVDPHGADAWADQALIAPGAAIGAPPDPLSRAGQNWGLAPINPLQLRRRAFAPLVAALRANMRHAGILRID